MSALSSKYCMFPWYVSSYRGCFEFVSSSSKRNVGVVSSNCGDWGGVEENGIAPEHRLEQIGLKPRVTKMKQNEWETKVTLRQGLMKW